MPELGVMRAPGQVLFGEGMVAALGRVAAAHGGRVLVCTDGYLAGAEQGRLALGALREAGLEARVLDAAEPELPRASVEAAIEAAREMRPDCVVGLGGGSCLDLAKLVALGLATEGPLDRFYGEAAVPGPVLPMVAVPTTAGTGSEVTPVAVLSDPAIALKVGISSLHLVPRAAICDPRLTLGAPAAVSAYAGIDALAHAIEAFTAVERDGWEDAVDRVFVGRNVLSDRFALHAVELLGGSLRGAVEDRPAARRAALEGSLCAGLAFAAAGTAAAHALQYPLGARTKTPHGLGVGLLLPFVMAANAPACRDRLDLVAAALGVEGAEAAVRVVRDLGLDLGLPSTLSELELAEEDLAGMAEQALGIERLVANNPRPMTQELATEILRAAWTGDLRLN